MKLICEYPVGTLRNATTVNYVDTVATAIKSMPGIGKPFLIYESLPGLVAMADFEHYLNDEGTGPRWVVSSDVAKNKAMILEQLASPPLDALTFVG